MKKKDPYQYDWAHSLPLPNGPEVAKFISGLNAWQQQKLHITQTLSKMDETPFFIVFYRKDPQ